MTRNALGREIPEGLPGGRRIYDGSHPASRLTGRSGRVKGVMPAPSGKTLPSIEDAIRASGLKDGMTVSFHHHLRDGDDVLNMVLEACSRMGLKDLRVAASSIFPVHAPVVDHIRNGVVTAVEANYIGGPVGEAISAGLLPRPAILRTHGGRVRAIEAGELEIDIAFIAAPCADPGGNLNGVQGPSACGSLGYAVVDAQYARCVVAVTDNLVPFPACPISIPGGNVDFVVEVDSIGDAAGIVSGSTRITRDPVGLVIARNAARAIQASGLLKDGFSFQTGAGGTSLAVASFVRKMMHEGRIKGSFGLGGITEFFVSMLEEGLFSTLLDTQDFDATAVRSLRENPRHQEIDCGLYASPGRKGAAVDHLDVVVLGATEVDTSFNVNVTTSSDGVVMGGSGGHSDAAAGAKLTVIVTRALRTRLPVIRDSVTCVSTPGDSVDMVVTERGTAVNPARPDLAGLLRERGILVRDILEIKEEIEALVGRPAPLAISGRIVVINEYRDGSVIDVVRQVV